MSAPRPPVDLDFLVAGFSKCGTTTLRSLLAEHPGIFMPRGETWFFSSPGPPKWQRYRRIFAEAAPGALLGEGSGSYASFTGEKATRARILRAYPGIKLIFVARDPFDRIESSFREFHNSGQRFGIKCPWDLDTALDAIPHLIEDTHYEARIDNFRRFVESRQILVVFLEDLAADQATVLRRCFEFLGVDPAAWKPRARRRLNRGSLKFYDTARMRELRDAIYHPAMDRALKTLPLAIVDPLLEKLGMRKRFGEGHLDWTTSARDRILDAIESGTRDFLRTYGKGLDFWPRFAAAAARRSRGEAEPATRPDGGAAMTPTAPPPLPADSGRAPVIIVHESPRSEASETVDEGVDPVLAALSSVGITVRIRRPKTEVDAVATICEHLDRRCLFVSVNPARFEAAGLACPGVAYFTDELENVAAWRLFANQLGAAVTRSPRSARAVRRALGDDFPVLLLDPEAPSAASEAALAAFVDQLLGPGEGDNRRATAGKTRQRDVRDPRNRLGGGGRYSI